MRSVTMTCVVALIVTCVIVTLVIVFQRSLGFEHGRKAVQAETFVDRELHQVDFVMRESGQFVDLAQHAFRTAAGGLPRHREGISK
jgi:hypothetical protein